MKPEFELINEEPLTFRVIQQKAVLGRIIQTGQNSFNAIGTYFNVTLSDLEYAKSCFERAELQKADSYTKQIQLPIL